MEDFELLLASLTLKAPQLEMDELIRLQQTLVSACRVHDPEQADEMSKLLAKMKLKTSPVERNTKSSPSRPLFRFSAGTAPVGGLEPTPPSQPRDESSPFSTPSRSTGPRHTNERPPRPTFVGDRMSLDEEIVEEKKVYKFEMGRAPEPRSSERKKRISRQLKAAFDSVSSNDKKQERFNNFEKKIATSPPAPRKQSQPSVCQLGDPPPFPLMKENDPPPAPPLAANKPNPSEMSGGYGFCLGATNEQQKGPQRFRQARQPPKMAANLRNDELSSTKLVFDQKPAAKYNNSQKYDEQYGNGVELYESGKYIQAVQALNQALSQAPNTWHQYAACLALRGGCYLLLDQPIEALRDCQDAASRDPTLYSALNRCGRLKLSRGQIEAAENEFASAKRAALQQPFNTDAVAATATADTGIADCKRYIEHTEAAKSFMARAFELAAAADEDNSSVLLSASRRKQETLKAAAKAQAERARRSADEPLLLAPRDPVAARLKAVALATMKKWSELEAFCTNFAPSAVKAHFDGFVFDNIQDDKKNLSIEPGELTAALCKCDAWSINIENNQDTLAELFAKSLRQRESPESGKGISPADEALAAIAASEVAPDAARERARIKLQRAAKFRRAKERADSAYTRGHYRAAVAMYRDALRLEGDDNDALRASVHANLAAAALVLDRPSEAVDHCTKALLFRSNYMRARLRRARAHAKLDHYTEAIKDFDAFLQSKNDFSGVDSHESVKKERDDVERDLLRRRTRSKATNHNQQAPCENTYSTRFHFTKKQQHHQNHSSQQQGDPKIHKTSSRISTLPSTSGTHYTVLGLGPQAQTNDIKRAYARLALQYHPDRNKSEHATAAMARINEAYECLKDPVARASYDFTAGLRRRRATAWPCS